MSETDTTQDTSTDVAPDEEQATEQGESQVDSELEEIDRDEAQTWKPDELRRKISKINNEIRATKRKLEAAQAAPKATEQRIGELESHNLRLEVGYELGLPLAIAKRLQGSTREEMLADAEALVELVAPTKAPATRRPTETLRGGGQPDREPEETDVRKIADRMCQH